MAQVITEHCAWCGKRVRQNDGLLDIGFAGIIGYHRGRCQRMLRKAYHTGIETLRARGVILRKRRKRK